MEKSLEIWIRVGKSLWKTSWSWRNGLTRSRSLMMNGTLRENIWRLHQGLPSLDTNLMRSIDNYPHIIDKRPPYIIARHPLDSIELHSPDCIDRHPWLDELSGHMLEPGPIVERMQKSKASHPAVREHQRPPICAEEAVGFHKRPKMIHEPVKIVVPCAIFEVEFPIPPDQGAHLSSYIEGANIPPCLSSDPRIPRGGDCEIVPVLDAMPLSISYEEANAYWRDEAWMELGAVQVVAELVNRIFDSEKYEEFPLSLVVDLTFHHHIPPFPADLPIVRGILCCGLCSWNNFTPRRIQAAIALHELQFGPGVEDDLDPVEEDHASPDA
ncbi:hypothetical protein Bca52824_058209 [Brassica carinata]|uniref:Uncharacterized protein n=1 Tax=Brassica carinata TaxID=52824 RepID=A0A8X7UEI2_BRACI|nr:hypothetical protein Bca52824_058209 [Brassica carinata]